MRLKTGVKTGLIFVLIILFFVFINLTGFSEKIKNSFYGFTTPFQEKLWLAGRDISDFFSGIFNKKELEGRIRSLESENQDLLSLLVGFTGTKEENLFLRESLGIGFEKDFQLEISQIIGKDISEDSVLINKGKKDGLERDFPVITSEKVLLGRVGEVYDNFSEVVLITNPNSSFDVRVFEKEVYGIIKGKGSADLLLDLIPKENELSEGDLVVSSALGGIFPEGLLVGRIREIKRSDVEIFQKAVIDPSFDLGSLKTVLIIKDF
ncbi:MAG: rod shape-determining protein MreC [Candidatus Nealsonbacteria bacterium]